MSGESYMESDFYKDSDYTADISTKMRVPDRLTAHGGVPGAVCSLWLCLNVRKVLDYLI